MQIKGIESMTAAELSQEVARGGKFVIYQYAISVVILSFKQGTDVYFVRSTENAVVKGLPYTLLTLVAGWWGIPFGPIFSVMALFNNLKGGKDVTKEVMNILNVRPAQPTAETVAA
jgi:hypothetical protein